MTSPGCKEEFCNTLTFRISGKMCHKIGTITIFSLQENDPRFLQLYFINNAEREAERRRVNTLKLKITLLKNLQEMLHEDNKYVREFKSVSQRLMENDCAELKVILREKRHPSIHEGRTNLP